MRRTAYRRTPGSAGEVLRQPQFKDNLANQEDSYEQSHHAVRWKALAEHPANTEKSPDKLSHQQRNIKRPGGQWTHFKILIPQDQSRESDKPHEADKEQADTKRKGHRMNV